MRTRRETRNHQGATTTRHVSLDRTEQQDLDRKMLEAIERIERVRSKAMLAVGAMLAKR